MYQYKQKNIVLGIALLGSICTVTAQQPPNDPQDITVFVPDIFGTKLMFGKPVEGFTEQEIRAFQSATTLEDVRSILNPLIEQNNAEALATLALIELRTNNHEIGLNYLKRAAEEYHHPKALINMGYLYAAVTGNPNTLDQAKEYLHIAADECNEPDACALLAELYLSRDKAQAKKYLHRIADEFNNPSGMWFLATSIYIQEENYEMAKLYCHKIIDTQEFAASNMYAEALNTLGWIHAFVEHNHEKGKPYLHEAADMHSHSCAQLNLGCVYQRKENAEQAIVYFESFLNNTNQSSTMKRVGNTEENKGTILFDLATLHEKTGNHARAQECLCSAAEDYKNTEAACRIWHNYLNNGQTNEGFVYLQKLANLHHNPFANAIVGILLCEKNPLEAHRYLDKDPNHNLSQFFKGLLLLAENKIDAGIATLQPLADLEQPGAIFALWQTYKIRGDSEQAKNYKAALESLKHIDIYSLQQIITTIPGEAVPSLHYLSILPMHASGCIQTFNGTIAYSDNPIARRFCIIENKINKKKIYVFVISTPEKELLLISMQSIVDATMPNRDLGSENNLIHPLE
jgi:tetratricopeptide (TPR) repeat protein